MRGRMWSRALAAVVAVAALGVAGYALAAGVAVTLGPSGPQPGSVTADWGDTVTFVNGDSVTHGITSPRTDFQVTAIPPAATYTNVVTAHSGSYQYRQTGDKSFPATLVVLATGKVSLTAKPASILYGQPVLVSGTATKPDTPVLVEQRAAGSSAWQQAATLTSGADGAFATHLQLAAGVKLRASIDGAQVRSGTVTVAVQPRLSLTASPKKTVAGHAVAVRVKVTPPHAALRVTVSTCNELEGRWVAATPRRPGANGVAIVNVRPAYGRTHIRASIARRDAAAGFESRTSSPVAVTATGVPPRAKKRRPHHC